MGWSPRACLHRDASYLPLDSLAAPTPTRDHRRRRGDRPQNIPSVPEGEIKTDRRAIYIWDYEFDHGLVERERPAVVNQEMVERSLMGPFPVDF